MAKGPVETLSGRYLTPLDISKINLHTDLQQYPFDDHDLLPGVDAERGELRVVGQRPHRPDEVLALLRGLLRLARQKQAAGRHNLKEKRNQCSNLTLN